MAELNDSGAESGTSGWFTVDGSYLKQQVSAAFRTFIAPLSGVYDAVVDNRQASHDAREDRSSRRP